MSIAANLAAVQARIARACAASGRDPSTVTLVAVSKTHPASAVRDALAAGQTLFGENKAQELRDKADVVGPEAHWHFIGTLQRNKARLVVGRAEMVHSVDSLELAQELSRRSERPLAVLIQVHVGGESTKSGVAPERALALCRDVQALPHLELRGLMTIPPPAPDMDTQRAHFAIVRQVAEEGRRLGLPLRELSMGMSDDLEAAIAEGATLVRVGTAIFGQRQPAT